MIEALRRGVVVVTALLAGGAGSAVFLCCALLAEGLTMPVETLHGVVGFLALDAAMAGGDAERMVRAGLGFVWLSLLALCFAPIIVAALLGEVARLRSGAWYGGLAGLGAAIAPTAVRAVMGGIPSRPADTLRVESRLTVVFFLTGVLGGLIYWLIASRKPPASPRPGQRMPPPTVV